MINWLKNLFKSKVEEPTKFVKTKYKVKMCQLYAHVGIQEYKYHNAFAYEGQDPIKYIKEIYTYYKPIGENVQVGNITIPFHKVDKIEAKVWEVEKEELLVDLNGRRYTLNGVEIVEFK